MQTPTVTPIPRAGMPDLLTVDEAAKALRTSRRTVEDACRRGDLRFLFLGKGRIRRIHADDLAAYVESRRTVSVYVGTQKDV